MVTVNHQYDSMGRRISSTVNNQSILYVYDGWNVVEEYSSSNLQSFDLKTILTWGIDLSGSAQGAGGVGGLLFTEDITSNTTWHHHYDGNGNVTHLTNASGQTVATYTYDAFGNTVTATGTAATANRYRFSTKPIDEHIATTPLYYYGFRYYAPDTGRWLSRDPLGDEAFFQGFVSQLSSGNANDEEEDEGMTDRVEMLRKQTWSNLYLFTKNSPLSLYDYLGLLDLDFFNPGTWEDADSATHPDKPDIYDVGAHGCAGSMYNSRTGKHMSAAAVAAVMMADPNFAKKKKVKLWSCSTGQGNNSFAQQLADIVGKPVIAPIDDLIASGTRGSGVLNDGKTEVACCRCPFLKLFGRDGWKTFKPTKKK